MNEFKRRKVQSLTLGEKLRNIRNNKRVSLSDVAKNTRIQIEYLEYLERGAYDRLPADVYVKGFLRSFAEYLNADEKDLIRSFKKEKSIQQNIRGDEKNENIPSKINLSNFSVNPKIISIILVSLLFMGLSFYLYKKLDNFVSTPELIILNPDTYATVNNSQVLVSGRTDEGNEVFINNQPVLVNENGAFEENLMLRNGINIIVIRSVNRFNKEAVREISVDAQYEVEIPEENRQEENSDEGTDIEESVENEETTESVEKLNNAGLENPNAESANSENSAEENLPVNN